MELNFSDQNLDLNIDRVHLYFIAIVQRINEVETDYECEEYLRRSIIRFKTSLKVQTLYNIFLKPPNFFINNLPHEYKRKSPEIPSIKRLK